MAGSPIDQTPSHWKRLSSTSKIVARVSSEDNMLKSHVIESSRGKGSETKAHYKLAIEYAAYLDVEFKSWMLGIIGDYIEAPEDFIDYGEPVYYQ